MENINFLGEKRLEMLFDEGTFVELGAFATNRASTLTEEEHQCQGDGVTTGYGKINGRVSFAFSQNIRVMSGSFGEIHGKKIVNIIRKAIDTKSPIICILNSKGIRLQEGIRALQVYNEIYLDLIKCTNIPVITLVIGENTGLQSFLLPFSDFVIMEQDSSISVNNRNVVSAFEKMDLKDFGNESQHSKNNNCHFISDNTADSFGRIREVLEFLPPTTRAIQRFEPTDNIKPLDFKMENFYFENIAKNIFDETIEYSKMENKNVYTAFGEILGYRVGIVANDEEYNGGALTSKGIKKISDFINLCNKFNIPIITFVNTPGIYPSYKDECDDLLSNTKDLLTSYSNSKRKITIYMNKAYGNGFNLMCPKEMGADVVFAWHTAEISILGPESVVNVLYNNEIKNADDPLKIKSEYLEYYKNNFTTPLAGGKMGILDNIINYKDTKLALVDSLALITSKLTQ
ncbi:MAG: carboxyl transferase domain-containing protein [Lachnospirales bacterium]